MFHRGFFRLVAWGRVVFLGLLAVVLAATAGQALWQMTRPVESVAGVVEAVEETRLSNRAASYGLSLRTDEGGLAYVQLRNNGRILEYLLEQEEPAGRRVIVRYRRGRAVELAPLDGMTPTIRESAAPAVASLLVVLPGLVVLLLLGRPELVERWLVK